MRPNKNATKKIIDASGKIILPIFLFFACLPYAPANAQSDPKLNLKVSSSSKEIPYETYYSWFTFNPSLSSNNSYSSEIENIEFCPTYEIFCRISKTENEKLHTKLVNSGKINHDQLRIFLNDFSKEANKAPTEAKFKMEGEKVVTFAMDEKGFEIDIEKSLEEIKRSLAEPGNFKENLEINLPYKTIEPQIKSTDINNLGINSLIGQGKSNFKGSPKSRIHNINVATKKYDGILIAPGEEFSFVETLGPVDGENGYLPELVIKQDKTEPEFGGGICQVSTTAFRAAIYSGLEITARKNHAYPVQYYNPQGMDATVYIPKPDLKFKNNTPGYILIQTEISGTELTFNFFGTSDGRKVEIDGPRIIQRNSDGSMRATFTQKVANKDGNILIEDTFNSFYDSPSKYPHPGEEKITKKPEDWSNKQWEAYKKANGL